MEIYTGYFALTKKYQEAGLIPISIARITPKWFTEKSIKELAPAGELLDDWKNGKISPAEYKERYIKQLDEVKWARLLKQLDEIGGGIVLCCYEKPTDFCHRHVLAEYLRENDINVYEVTPKFCLKNCRNCQSLSGRQDDNGNTWGYECLKFGEGVDWKDFPALYIKNFKQLSKITI